MQVLHEVNYVAAERGTHSKALPLMATFTVRHEIADPASTARDVRGCWRRFLQGREWEAMKAELGGGAEWIAAEEITYGLNGWHPHMHVLFMPQHEPRSSSPELRAYLLGDAMAERWRAIVTERMGAEHAPSLERGTVLTRCYGAPGAAAYIAKIAWELTDATGGKSDFRQSYKDPDSGRRGISMLDLMMRAVDDPNLKQKYHELCAARHRQRDLTWSTGLRVYRDAFAALPSPELETVATIRGSDFERIKHRAGGEDLLLELTLARARADVEALLASAHVRPMTDEEVASNATL